MLVEKSKVNKALYDPAQRHGQPRSVANTVRDVRGGLKLASALAIRQLKHHGQT